MSGKVIGWIVVAIVVIGGILYFINMSSSAPSSSSTSTSGTSQDQTTQPAAGSQTGNGTIGALMAMGNVKCDISTSGANASQGTVYVSSGKMRGDFTSNTSSGTTHASMVNDGTNIYTWTDLTTQGFKMSDAAAKSGSAGASHVAVSNSTTVTYTCVPWTVDTTVFTPPANISFMTVGGTQ